MSWPTGSDELQRVQKALPKISIKLLAGDARLWIRRIEESTKDVKDLVRFQPANRIGYANTSRSKARRFTNSCDEMFRELIMRHVRITSEQFPRVVFLVEYWAIQKGYTSKIVIRAGDVSCWALDGHQQAKGPETLLKVDPVYIVSSFRHSYRHHRRR